MNLAGLWSRRSALWPRQARGVLQRPLLDTQELLALRRQARSAGASALLRVERSRHPQLGEQASPIHGSGMDFDESRPYVAGDDRRFINWRMLARSGELHLKLFHEERRSQLFIVLDRRSSMRMGSQGCLKLTQAARLASLFACLAVEQDMAVGAVLIEPQPQWLRPMSGERQLHRLLGAFRAPAPPLADAQPDGLQQVMDQLRGRLLAGSVVLLLSDFPQLDARLESGLWALVREHRVMALQLSDPMEHTLPAEAGLRFQAEGDREACLIDGRQPQLRNAYAERMQHHQQHLAQGLGKLGVEYAAISTLDDIGDTQVLRGRLHGR